MKKILSVEAYVPEKEKKLLFLSSFLLALLRFQQNPLIVILFVFGSLAHGTNLLRGIGLETDSIFLEISD